MSNNQDQGSFVLELIEQISGDVLTQITCNIACVLLEASVEIDATVAERDQDNEATDTLPPFLPHELALLPHRDFCAIVRS